MPRHDIPAVRVLPMSDKHPAFRDRSIEDVQRKVFLRDLPRAGGKWRYHRTGLNADPWTIVLFQFKAHVIASATFFRDERFDEPAAKNSKYAGALFFEADSFRTFDPIDAATMRLIWPAFPGFGQVKHSLNAANYPAFKRRLKNVCSPTAR